MVHNQEKDIYRIMATDALLSNSAGHIYWKNSDGVFLGCNEEQARYFGFKDPSEIIGKTNFDLVDRESAIKITEADRKVIETGEPQVIEEMLYNSRWFLSKKIPLRNFSGEVVGIFGTSMEITEQKLAKEAVVKQNMELIKAMEVKDRFLKNLSHEIRTPINGIFGILEGLEDEKIWNNTSDYEKRKLFRAFLASRDRFMNLLSNMLDLSSLKQGREDLQIGYCDIKNIITDVAQEFKHLADCIRIDTATNAKTYILCDDWRIGQVLRHVIANAIKFGGHDKPIQITLDTHEEDKSRCLKIAVQDEGVGIPEEQLEEIFSPFTESDRTKRMSGGTGIGLAICKDIVAGHKGKIWAENNSHGIGSTFFITLPYEEHPKKAYSYSLTRVS